MNLDAAAEFAPVLSAMMSPDTSQIKAAEASLDGALRAAPDRVLAALLGTLQLYDGAGALPPPAPGGGGAAAAGAAAKGRSSAEHGAAATLWLAATRRRPSR